LFFSVSPVPQSFSISAYFINNIKRQPALREAAILVRQRLPGAAGVTSQLVAAR
jgi:hypothetical protein